MLIREVENGRKLKLIHWGLEDTFLTASEVNSSSCLEEENEEQEDAEGGHMVNVQPHDARKAV